MLKGGESTVGADGTPIELSYTTVFGSPTVGELETHRPTYSSVVLDAASGWLVEPEGATPTTAQMEAVLGDLDAVLIRGDEYVYGEKGPGQEVTYISDVAIYPR